MDQTRIHAAVYDTKSYDRDYLGPAADGESLEWQFHDFRLTADTAVTASGLAAACVFVNDQVDRRCLEILARNGVRHVALRCAGHSNVDLVAAKALDIAVTRVPAYSPHAVAEHAVALLMTLNRKIHRAYNRVREHNFSLGGLIGFDIRGKTVGIIGTGKIGRVAARIFRGFEAKVVAYDVDPDLQWAEDNGVRYTDLPRLLGESDIISLHVPLVPETHHVIRETTIAQIKPGAFLINTGRGKLIETGALIAALRCGHLGGVALDVYEEEEGVFFEDLSETVLQDDELTRLLTFPNVLVTAHQGFLTREALGEIARVTAANITRLSRGEPPLEGTRL